MNSAFPNWIQEADPDATHDDIARWWSGIEEVLGDDTAGRVFPLVAMAYGAKTYEDLAESQFLEAFRRKDLGFRPKGNENLLRIIAGAALIEVINERDEHALAAALLVRVATGTSRVAACSGVPSAASACLEAMGFAARKRSRVTRVALAEGLPQVFDPGDLNKAKTTVETALKALDKLQDAARSTDRDIQLMSEEVDVLWWMFGECSAQFGPLKKIDRRAFPLVVTQELASHFQIVPEPGATERFLARLYRVSDMDMEAALCPSDVFAVADPHWSRTVTKDLPANFEHLFPLHFGLAGQLRGGNWADRIKYDAAFDASVNKKSIEIARQFLFERVALMAVAGQVDG